MSSFYARANSDPREGLASGHRSLPPVQTVKRPPESIRVDLAPPVSAASSALSMPSNGKAPRPSRVLSSAVSSAATLSPSMPTSRQQSRQSERTSFSTLPVAPNRPFTTLGVPRKTREGRAQTLSDSLTRPVFVPLPSIPQGNALQGTRKRSSIYPHKPTVLSSIANSDEHRATPQEGDSETFHTSEAHFAGIGSRASTMHDIYDYSDDEDSNSSARHPSASGFRGSQRLHSAQLDMVRPAALGHARPKFELGNEYDRGDTVADRYFEHHGVVQLLEAFTAALYLKRPSDPVALLESVLAAEIAHGEG